MTRLVIGLIIGLFAGGALTFYLFVGVPQAGVVPGIPTRPPDPNGLPPGSAEIVLRQQFFNDVLATIFEEMDPPAMPLNSAPPTADCDGRIKILRDGSGTATAISFADGRMSSQLAFTGSYASPFGCLNFTGWAQANFQMRFDQQTQTVFGQINVETVNLDGVNPIVSALLTPIVQSTLNTRVNPIRILDGRQIAVDLPVAAANGNLVASVSDVRADIRDDALHLYVIYDFSGGPLQSATP